MFYAVVDSLSLNNPTVLNDCKQIKVIVQLKSHSNISKYHYVFIQQSKDDSIIEKIQNEMKKGWYSLFWDETQAYIVFNKRQFKIAIPDGWSSKPYEDAQIFAKSQGIQEEYLDFKKDFDRYSEFVGS